ncbi:DUF1801 domain-containing protein [Hoeflea poritis]|uniref:DUF1801 domain-containing protein n=1 Tax=Hoeflea poritis TaxID=2993659 RepID=A0ABT4VJP4_9HYPH|nr:DUF1801 domain-containing protein [Hoeflea poritis]MDA4844824.1 DUF1801 domain-containing protein [Hoeflea poritis]
MADKSGKTTSSKRTVALKTRPGNGDVDAFLAGIEDEAKRADSQVLMDMMNRVTGRDAVMWGSSIIGFGTYTYTYADGRSAQWMVTGFSPRKTALTVYVMPGFSAYDRQLSRLGRYKTGKSCLYIKRLSDVDLDVLEAIVADAYRHMKENYPD